MSAIKSAIAVVGGAILGGNQAKKQANAAAASQENQARAAISDQQAREEEVKKLFMPYLEAGVAGIGAQRELMGLGGPGAQQKAIEALQASPEFTSLIQQGENAMLQNAAATGGLRGGNLQNALARFRPQVLASLINQQYARLGDLSRLGQASVVGQAAQSQAAGQQIAAQFGNIGAAQAGANLTPGATLGATGAVQGIGAQFLGGGIKNYFSTGSFLPTKPAPLQGPSIAGPPIG